MINNIIIPFFIQKPKSDKSIETHTTEVIINSEVNSVQNVLNMHITYIYNKK